MSIAYSSVARSNPVYWVSSAGIVRDRKSGYMQVIVCIINENIQYTVLFFISTSFASRKLCHSLLP